MIKTIKGIVVKGRGIGKQLGFLTANIKSDINLGEDDFGVYAGEVFIDNKKYQTGIFIGPAPTFELTTPTIEAHIIDFDQDIYGQEIELYLIKKLRNIEKFNSFCDLQQQIKKDILTIKNICK